VVLLYAQTAAREDTRFFWIKELVSTLFVVTFVQTWLICIWNTVSDFSERGEKEAMKASNNGYTKGRKNM
jgi:hypothetical protein